MSISLFLPSAPPALHPDLSTALAMWREGSVIQAELMMRRHLGRAAAAERQFTLGVLAQLASDREDARTALGWLLQTLHELPQQESAWLAVAELLAHEGQTDMAVRCRDQALARAQSQGRLISAASTPTAWQGLVPQWLAQVQDIKAQALDALMQEAYDTLGPATHGLDRVRRALDGYLGRIPIQTHHPAQKPKFLYVPDLPAGPYHDPFLQPWTPRLLSAFDAIRQEALQVAFGGGQIQSFLEFAPGQDRSAYVGGQGKGGQAPAWDAFFFWRRGQRFDGNHLSCPQTSAVLSEIELCEIESQTPEICFSLLLPGSHIQPHHGVSNMRLVYHLPLLVPSQCALSVRGGGEHAWQERVPMMFDDTWEHEAWNRSEHLRIVLLMDSWNPHLSPPERLALRDLVEWVGRFEKLEPADLSEALGLPPIGLPLA